MICCYLRRSVRDGSAMAMTTTAKASIAFMMIPVGSRVSPMDHENLRLRERRPWKLARMWLFGHAAKGDTGQAPHPRRSRAIPACSSDDAVEKWCRRHRQLAVLRDRRNQAFDRLLRFGQRQEQLRRIRRLSSAGSRSLGIIRPRHTARFEVLGSFTRSPGAVSKYPNAL